MSLNLVMMALGAIRFGMRNEAFQTFSHDAGYRWAEVNRIGRAPALQYLGPEAQTVKISGVIYPHFRGGLRQVDVMRARAGTGIPFMLIGGAGLVFKRWSITQVSETKSFFLPDGAPQKIEFALNLKSYGENGRGLLQTARALL